MLKFLQRLIHSSRHKRKSPSALRQRLAFSKEDIKKHATEYAIERDGYVWVKSPGTWEDSRKLKLQCDGEGCYFRLDEVDHKRDISSRFCGRPLYFLSSKFKLDIISTRSQGSPWERATPQVLLEDE